MYNDTQEYTYNSHQPLSCIYVCFVCSIDQSDSESASGCVAHGLQGGKPATMRASRAPTLEECESAIKQLQLANNQQSHEVMTEKRKVSQYIYYYSIYVVFVAHADQGRFAGCPLLTQVDARRLPHGKSICNR